MTKEQNEYIEKLETGYSLKSAKNIIYIIIIIGATFNFLAMVNNHGLMPVKSYYNLSDETHFSYVNNSEVQYPLFTDRYQIYTVTCSLGDILLVSGGLLLLVMGIWDLMNGYQLNKIKSEFIKEVLNGKK
jgi:hypothetical protein